MDRIPAGAVTHDRIPVKCKEVDAVARSRKPCPRCGHRQCEAISWWLVLLAGLAVRACSAVLLLLGLSLAGMMGIITGILLSLGGLAGLVNQYSILGTPVQIVCCDRCNKLWLAEITS